MHQMELIKEHRISELLKRYGVFAAFIILFVGNAIFTKNFLSINTVQNILSQSTTTVLLGVGMTIVIATGGINISVGSMMALSAMISAKFIAQGNYMAGILLGIGAAVFCGFLTGYVIIKFNIQPMIASLAMMFVLRGITKLLNDGKNMNPRWKEWNSLLYETFAGIPARTVIWLICVLIIVLFVYKTRFGICIESYGDNHLAARISGIHTVLTITGCYIICSVLSGIAGIVEMGYSSIVDPGNMGLSKEMDAIAATVLGGTSIDGGKPHIWGTVCGAMVLQLITVMVNMNDVPASYAKIIKAAIIILAVYLQGIRKKGRE